MIVTFLVGKRPERMLRQSVICFIALTLGPISTKLLAQTQSYHNFNPAGVQFAVPSDWAPQNASGGLAYTSPDKHLIAAIAVGDVSCTSGDQDCMVNWLQSSFPKNARDSGLKIANGSVIAQAGSRNNMRGATFQANTTDGSRLAGFAGFHNGKVFTLLVGYSVSAEGYVTQQITSRIFDSLRPIPNQAATPPMPAALTMWRVNKVLTVDASRCVTSARTVLTGDGYKAGQSGDLATSPGHTGGHYVYGTSDRDTVGMYCLDGPNGSTWLDVVFSSTMSGAPVQPVRNLADRVEALANGR